jgi:nitroreductase
MVLAPSAHNTQPWSFAVKDNQIDVLVDVKRHLAVSDPTQRQAYVSLGCAIMNGRVAAAHNNWLVEVVYLPAEGVAARMMFTDATADKHFAKLYPAIAARRTDRSLFTEKLLTDTETAALRGLASDLAIAVDDPNIRMAVAKLVEAGTLDTLQKKDFKQELSHWVRHSWTKQSDGMPGYAMGMPALVSLLAPLMVKVAPIHQQEGPKTKQQALSAPLIIAISTQADTRMDWLKSGELLQQLWLEATAAGLAASPLTAPIEASQDIRNQLRGVLHTNRYPQTVIRIGHSNQQNLKATPRRTVADCLT